MNPFEQHLLCFFILLISIKASKSANIVTSNNTALQTKVIENEQITNDTAAKIETLKKEKDDLYNKINKAIDEVIPELEKVNDTEANTGLEHVKILKQQLKQIHEAESDYDSSAETDNSTNKDARRKLSIKVARGRDWFAKQKTKTGDFVEQMIKVNKRYTSLPQIVNRQKIAVQIEQWLKKQAEEKKRKKEHRANLKIQNEKCPDFGRGKNKKKIDGKKPKGNKNYPCCRKCCKKSYLGCL